MCVYLSEYELLAWPSAVGRYRHPFLLWKSVLSTHGFVTIVIQRDECEKDRGCCFDHTVEGVAWCFHGRPRDNLKQSLDIH